MINNSLVMLLFFAATSSAFVSCNDDSNKTKTNQTESALAGTLTVLVDPEILPLLRNAKALYDKEHPNAHVSLVASNVAESMNRMLNHEERIAIIARDYTASEDSAVANDPDDTLPRSLLARDALVFFVAKDFPYDTMNADHIRRWLAGEDVRSSYPRLAKDPVFILSGGSTGSIYGNVINVVLKGKEPSRARLTSLPSHDSVVAVVAETAFSIGVGYLSQIVRDTSVKPLRLGYANKDGTHEWPKPVHVSYLIMGKYPFPVPIYIYLRDRPNQFNLASGFMQFMTRNAAALKTFLTAGIEPGYGKFSLVMTDN